MPKILVTGGLGYIGCHTVVRLIENDYDVIVYDNLSNSKLDVYSDILEITQCEDNNDRCRIYIGDILNLSRLEEVFSKHKIDGVIHFAGLKSVSESIKNPMMYYKNNVQGTLNLLQMMEKYNVNNFIFSSSATVYGNEKSPLTEDSLTGIGLECPYGKTKFIIEEMMKDFKNFSTIILRYFNPIGCHKSAIIGDNPLNTPTNLFPIILEVASGKRQHVDVFGKDYLTKDGTCIRDFIHVDDLANAHNMSLKKLMDNRETHIFKIYNVGSGTGYSVLDLINTFERVNNIKIPIKFVEKRLGDLSVVYADITKIKRELGWVPFKKLEDMCKDGYAFIKFQAEYNEEDFLLDETFVSEISELSGVSENILETIIEEIEENFSSSSE